MKKGFTLIEFLVYIGIFTVVMIGFMSIFVGVTRVQVSQSSSAEVEQQSLFILQQLQYYIAQASLVDIPKDTATSTLSLRTSNLATDPTTITLSNGTIYLQQASSGAPQALTSSQVTISNLTFTKHSNPPAHDTVSVAFTVAYNTSNIEQMFSQAIQTSVARVSAATFDSDIRASSTNTWVIGSAANEWKSINGTIFFSGTNAVGQGSNVGIGWASPLEALDVAGGIHINSGASPACDGSATPEGTLWYTSGGGSTSSTLKLCFRNVNGYGWVNVYPPAGS